MYNKLYSNAWLTSKHFCSPYIFRLVELNHSTGLGLASYKSERWIIRDTLPVCILSVVSESSSGVLDSAVADCGHGQ